MAETLKVQLEDEQGNIYYLKTDASNVYCSDGTSVETKLNAKIDVSNIVNNTTTNDSNKVASAAVVKSLQDIINTLSDNSMQYPRLFDNLYGKSNSEIMNSVPNWQVCGLGFKGWNDPVSINSRNCLVFYTKGNILAIADDGDMYKCTSDNYTWTKIDNYNTYVLSSSSHKIDIKWTGSKIEFWVDNILVKSL